MQRKNMKLNLLIKISFLSWVIFFNNVFATTNQQSFSLNARDPLKILNQINQYRTKHGLSPLYHGKYLSEIAAAHSRDMAELKIPFGHKGFDKRSQEIFSEYKFYRPQAFAENVVMNYCDDDKKIVELWLASSSHRKNIEGDYNWTGIGKIIDKNGMVYVTQVFLKIKGH